MKRFQLKNKIINDYKFYDVKGGGEARGGYRRRSLNRTREKKTQLASVMTCNKLAKNESTKWA